jgi:phospholipase/carboxylesterase
MTRPAPQRGTYRVAYDVPWRLDGAATDPGAPLVLALHGMGMDEDAFALVLQRLLKLPCRFLIPRAPFPLEVRREHRIGAAWYAYDGDAERFRRELDRLDGLCLDLVRRVEAAHGLQPRARVVLGFSQGGYCGAVVALRHPELFHGLVVSGARVKTEMLEAELPRAAASGFQVLLLHGRRDVHVVHEAAEKSRDGLAAAGVAVQLRTFDAGHAFGREQQEAVAEWLRRWTTPSPGPRAGRPPF